MSLTLQDILKIFPEDNGDDRFSSSGNNGIILRASFVNTMKIICDGVTEDKKNVSSSLLNKQYEPKPIVRDTFYKSYNNIFSYLTTSGDNEQSITSPKDHHTRTPPTDGTNNPLAGTREKLLLEMTTTSTRIPCDNKRTIDHIAETISIALTDVHNESYGVTGNKRVSNVIRGIKDLAYTFSDLAFNPEGCTWTGRVNYSCEQTVDSVTNQGTQDNVFVEDSCKFIVQCQTVMVNQSLVQEDAEEKKESNEVNSKIDNWGMKHHSIDIQALIETDDQQHINVLKIISETMKHIQYDIERALYCLYLPIYPEGCGTSSFRSIYQLNSKLKSGAFGTVCRGTHRSTQKSVAVKIVRRDRLQPNADVAILREVHLHGSLKHDSIIPIVDFFMEDQCYFIVMELMEGGDVFDRIGSLKQYNEEIARDLCTKLLKAVAHCHENNIVHCDLKPGNLLLKSVDDHASVMVADFGFARHVFAPKSIIEQRGTPYFIAPEIICRDPYDQSADMWSVGVIIYCLISGQMPFVGKRTIDVFKAILNQDYDFSDKAWDNVSDSAKDLISKLLVTDPNERYTAIDALNSTWISNSDKLSLTLNSLPESASNMKTFSARLKLKTAILTVQSVTRWKLVLKNKDPNRSPSAVPGDLTECV